FLCVSGLMLAGCSPARRDHVFQLKEPPEMLTEELAMEKARATMSKEGYDLQQWHLIKIDSSTGLRPSKAPNGTPDLYFERFRPTWGRFHFRNGTQSRTVQVGLEGDRVVCNVVQLP
ncbi:MAG: hypothetical protein MUC91_11390, partial [Verrucomicrobia bacterium]|nr:hypothetical protein [Verrucomicrobiota bacterium]